MGNALTRTSATVKPHVDPSTTNIVAVKVRHILLSDEKLLQKCREEIEKGRPFDAVAREFSACPSAARGGDLGWVPRGSLQKDFEAACLAANENQLQSTKTSFGFHLFIVEAKKTHSMESPQQSAQVSEALRLLSHSIVSRTVPEAHPVWAVPSKETKRKRGPSRNDPPKNNKNEEETKVTGVLTEKELDQLFVRWKNDPSHWTPVRLAQEYSLDTQQVYHLLCYTGVWNPVKDRDGKVRGYLCSSFLQPLENKEETSRHGHHSSVSF